MITREMIPIDSGEGGGGCDDGGGGGGGGGGLMSRSPKERSRAETVLLLPESPAAGAAVVDSKRRKEEEELPTEKVALSEEGSICWKIVLLLCFVGFGVLSRYRLLVRANGIPAS